MSHPEALVIPEGANLQQGQAGVSIENDGDIILHSDLGGLGDLVSRAGSIVIAGDFKLGGVRAAGSVELTGDLTVGDLSAGGGVTLQGDISAGSVSAGGDISLDGGLSTAGISAGGDLALRGSVSASDITGGGDLVSNGSLTAVSVSVPGAVRLSGAVEVKNVDGGAISLGGQSVKARAVRGSRSIALGSEQVSVDLLLSPQVSVAQSCRGRVAVIEAHNEIGPNALKGGFGLEEFAEFSGIDPDQFLAARNVRPLGAQDEDAEDSDMGADDPIEDSGAALNDEVAEDTSDASDESIDDLLDEPEHTPVDVVAEEDAAPADFDDGVESLDEIELEPVHSGPVTVEPIEEDPIELDPLQEKLLGILGQIDKCYSDVEEPPAISDLRTMITAGQYEDLRGQIANIWNDLLRFHQQNSMRVPHRVTNSFNNINSLVRNA